MLPSGHGACASDHAQHVGQHHQQEAEEAAEEIQAEKSARSRRRSSRVRLARFMAVPPLDKVYDFEKPGGGGRCADQHEDERCCIHS